MKIQNYLQKSNNISKKTQYYQEETTYKRRDDCKISRGGWLVRKVCGDF